MTELKTILEFAQALSSVGSFTLLLLVLFGSYFGTWFWGKSVEARYADYEKRLAECKASELRWQELAFKSAGMATRVIDIKAGQ